MVLDVAFLTKVQAAFVSGLTASHLGKPKRVSPLRRTERLVWIA